MKRSVGYVALACAVVCVALGGFLQSLDSAVFSAQAVGGSLIKLLFAAGVTSGFYGAYALVSRFLVARSANKRRAHDVRNVLRLVVGTLALVSVLGVLTEQWVGVLVSFGVVGFGITFALQQPLLSFLGWVYIMIKRPYAVGDRVAIEGSKGDVIEVDFLVTTLWEVDGDLVTTNQPSGRVVTVPNSVVLSSQVVNYSTLVDTVWNELAVQVAYETDLQFASETMIDVATDLLGDEMSRQIARYRQQLAETPVELDVQDPPTVNVVQKDTWVELRLRYLTHPRRGQRAKNELYRRVLAAFNDHPDRVKFPVGRSR
ncbi:MAG: mechanosensitive ion channel family protein [Salinigranum sp.]